jgi:hypothetical protein
MLQGGLKDDFRGKVMEAAYAPWDYDGNIPDPVLSARLSIQPLDDDGAPEGDPLVQNWSAGDLANFVPSEDGKTPCEDGEAGPYALRVGKRAGLNNNTNFAHLMESILDAGEASKGKFFTRQNLTASLECLVGLDAHWDRVPQKKRSGLNAAAAEGEGSNSNRKDVLVVSEVFGYGTKSGKVGGKAAPAKAVAGKKKTEPEPEEDDETTGESEVSEDDSDLRDMVTAIIAAAGDAGIKKGKLVGKVVEAAGKDKRKAAFIKRCTEASFLEADGVAWTLDEDTGVLTL